MTPEWITSPERACRIADSELFFHPKQERGEAYAERDEAAKALCRQCPFRIECRDLARENRETYGVWGGEDEKERRNWLRRQAREQAEGRFVFRATWPIEADGVDHTLAEMRREVRDEVPALIREAGAVLTKDLVWSIDVEQMLLVASAPARKRSDGEVIHADKVGTVAGAKRHYRAGESACAECAAAERRAWAEQRGKKAARKAAERAGAKSGKEVAA